MICRVLGLSLTHNVIDDRTACGKDAEKIWAASGEVTCAECIIQPELDAGNIGVATNAVLDFPASPDKAVALSITAALSNVVEARLRA
jgi:hypothetical protein